MIAVVLRADVHPDTFVKRALRCGVKLEDEHKHYLNWNGFNFGVDIELKCLDREIYLLRNLESDNIHYIKDLKQEKHMLYRLTVMGSNNKKCATGVVSLKLRDNVPVTVLHIDHGITFPVFIGCEFLFYNPMAVSSRDTH